jgi:hypothetical protein
MAHIGDYQDWVEQLQKENAVLEKKMRDASTTHQDTVAKLEALLALALNRANMTRQELEEALKKEEEALKEEEEEGLRESAWAMARGAYK